MWCNFTMKVWKFYLASNFIIFAIITGGVYVTTGASSGLPQIKERPYSSRPYRTSVYSKGMKTTLEEEKAKKMQQKSISNSSKLGQACSTGGGTLPQIVTAQDEERREGSNQSPSDLRSMSSRAASKSFWNMTMLHEREVASYYNLQQSGTASPDKPRGHRNRSCSVPNDMPQPCSLESRPVILRLSPPKGEEPRICVSSMESKPRPQLNGLYGLPKAHRRRSMIPLRKGSSFESWKLINYYDFPWFNNYYSQPHPSFNFI